MLSQLPILLLGLTASVAAVSVPQIYSHGGIANRAVEVSTFSPVNDTVKVTTTAQSEPTTAKLPVTIKVLDSVPSFLIGTQTGQGTIFTPGLGACGVVNNEADFIVAVSILLFDAFPGYNGVNPNTNPVCGKQIEASFEGHSVVVTVTDSCEACALTDLDFSPAAFSELADLSVGRISDVTWVWLD